MPGFKKMLLISTTALLLCLDFGGLTIKPWMSSHSPAQEELENLCFGAADPGIRKL